MNFDTKWLMLAVIVVLYVLFVLAQIKVAKLNRALELQLEVSTAVLKQLRAELLKNQQR